MAVKYYVDEKNRKTVAVLEGCRWDAINRIRKLMFSSSGYCRYMMGEEDCFMPDTFRAVVTCNELDEYNIEEGKRQAKKKLMRNYHRSLDKRIIRYKKYLMSLADTLNVDEA